MLGRLRLAESAEPIRSMEASVIIAAAADSLEFVPAVGTLERRWDSPQPYENERDSV